MRIIFVNTRFHYSSELMEMNEDNKYFYLYGMGHVLGWQIMEKYPDVKIENWRADKTVTEVKEKFVDGIYCRVFPSDKVNKFGEFSSELKKKLKTECKINDTVVHFMGAHSIPYYYYMLSTRCKNFVLTHLGGANPKWNYDNFKKLSNFLFYLLEKNYFGKKISHFWGTTSFEREYMKNIIGENRVSNTPIFGVNFNTFKIFDKNIIKKELNLPLDKKIVIQVGRAFKNRGVDLLINEWKKNRRKDIYLLLVGINETDELFNEVKKSGLPYLGQIFHYDLFKYYNASDVLVYLPWDKDSLEFAGPSYVPLECLACGTPVVATTMINFEGKIRDVFRIPDNVSDVLPMIYDLIDNPPDRLRCREAVNLNYGWETIVKDYYTVYNSLVN